MMRVPASCLALDPRECKQIFRYPTLSRSAQLAV
ncbi:hypothetical protein NOCA2280036 [metagenome]|uniref:Uncharacterized protein n=1 Tax=metagenome TaxID=256318 RepID=A0A2P2C0S9_9ZZZZ